MAHIPLPYHLVQQEDADSKSGFAVGGDVENVLRSRIIARRRQGRALPHEVVLVHIALAASVGFHATYGHWEILIPPGIVSERCSRAKSRAHILKPEPGDRTCDKRREKFY